MHEALPRTLSRHLVEQELAEDVVALLLLVCEREALASERDHVQLAVVLQPHGVHGEAREDHRVDVERLLCREHVEGLQLGVETHWREFHAGEGVLDGPVDGRDHALPGGLRELDSTHVAHGHNTLDPHLHACAL